MHLEREYPCLLANRDTLKEQFEQLKAAVKKVHMAKGRYHSQLAMCDLYDLCGLPNQRPITKEKT